MTSTLTRSEVALYAFPSTVDASALTTMEAYPSATGVTKPVSDTVATLLSLEVKEMISSPPVEECAVICCGGTALEHYVGRINEKLMMGFRCNI